MLSVLRAGNYLEHCGGFAWTVVEGSFGIDFSSDTQAAATVTPRFDPTWPSALGEFRLRGVDVVLEYTRDSKAGVTLRRKQRQQEAESGNSVSSHGDGGDTVRVRLVWDGKTQVVEL